MDFGDLLQILIGAAFVLFWLFGGKKKPRRRPAVQQADRSGDDLTGEGEVIAGSPDLTSTERMIREALGLPTEPTKPTEPTQLEPVSTSAPEAPATERMIREAIGLPTELEPVSTTAPEAPPAEIFETEAASLESLQVDSQERHSEFHEQYVDKFEPTKVSGGAQTAVPEINSSAARKGILWQIILGPPKSLE
ncbi:MAG: hypothetical protein IH877_08635 [Gemmatimonadetes bacterium]|nr:hypothetical protein [Gemmatimonadota bacterium]